MEDFLEGAKRLQPTEMLDQLIEVITTGAFCRLLESVKGRDAAIKSNVQQPQCFGPEFGRYAADDHSDNGSFDLVMRFFGKPIQHVE